MEISIVVTAHNYGKYLDKSLGSALNQDYTGEYEIIVVNDGSTDDTDEVLVKYVGNPRIKILKNEQASGLANACNQGIRASSGKYVIRLDADDAFYPSILSKLAAILDSDPTIGMAYPDYKAVDVDGNLLHYYVNSDSKLRDHSCLAAGAMYRKSCYDAIGGYNGNLKRREDLDYWIRFTRKFKTKIVHEPLYYYLLHPGSMSTNLPFRLRVQREVKQMYLQSDMKAVAVVKNANKKLLEDLKHSRYISRVQTEDTNEFHCVIDSGLVTIDDVEECIYTTLLFNAGGCDTFHYGKHITSDNPPTIDENKQTRKLFPGLYVRLDDRPRTSIEIYVEQNVAEEEESKNLDNEEENKKQNDSEQDNNDDVSEEEEKKIIDKLKSLGYM